MTSKRMYPLVTVLGVPVYPQFEQMLFRAIRCSSSLDATVHVPLRQLSAPEIPPPSSFRLLFVVRWSDSQTNDGAHESTNERVALGRLITDRAKGLAHRG